jgi:trans-4-hydroxy-L-proline dehydratase
VRRTGLIYPTVGVCWHEGTPVDLVELAIDLIGHGYSTPAFFGDATIQQGLKALGVPDDQAHHYINSTCVEITPAGGSNIWVASPYFSMCRILLDEMAHQVSTPSPAADFDSFRRSYLDRLAHLIKEAVEEQNEARRVRTECGRKPLQSVFTRDCIARGRDIDDGGALYNWVECSFVGLANMADSFHVIREEVFEQGRMSLEELKAILDAGFEGHEPERMRFLQGYPKYGQNSSEVDALFGETVAFVQAECAKHVLEPDDSPFVPGAFCWVMHERLGAECGATPDGRLAGVPFADGCGPAQGRETCGPTAAILSTTSWDHSPMIGGLAYNMKFNNTFFASPQGYASLRDLVLTFLRRGGFETQINVVDTETLKEAKAHPEDFRDLVVRIGGYTDYFARLSPQMQDEVIMRTEFTG